MIVNDLPISLRKNHCGDLVDCFLHIPKWPAIFSANYNKTSCASGSARRIFRVSLRHALSFTAELERNEMIMSATNPGHGTKYLIRLMQVPSCLQHCYFLVCLHRTWNPTTLLQHNSNLCHYFLLLRIEYMRILSHKIQLVGQLPSPTYMCRVCDHCFQPWTPPSPYVVFQFHKSTIWHPDFQLKWYQYPPPFWWWLKYVITTSPWCMRVCESVQRLNMSFMESWKVPPYKIGSVPNRHRLKTCQYLS